MDEKDAVLEKLALGDSSRLELVEVWNCLHCLKRGTLEDKLNSNHDASTCHRYQMHNSPKA